MKDKNILETDAVCTCEKCLDLSKRRLDDARNKWNNGERKIVVNNWDTGEDYAADVFISEFKVSTNGNGTASILGGVMDFLEIDKVDIKVTY